MPAKRSRIGRSSSLGDTGVLPPPPESADGGWMDRRAAASRKRPSNASPRASEKSVEVSSPPRILTLSSPVKESVGSRGKELVGDFLGRCYRCKKQINENAEVFMYSTAVLKQNIEKSVMFWCSYLRAFCTVECRDMQIAIDNEMEKASGSFQGMQLGPTQ
ncbi:hypothetical protein RHGRI_035778 [Rhododendron griersonianum]|uniref:FLZ-type domain-containing protein n=1 Tax=Rhododendron griersonianum TaxID=479676 RepID=A0AAV6HLE3_9ERIC|nr:hypothetical protein RHGRI_035778 [Rhododendron griersonianum]